MAPLQRLVAKLQEIQETKLATHKECMEAVGALLMKMDAVLETNEAMLARMPLPLSTQVKGGV